MEDQGKINKELVDALLAHMNMRRHGGREDNAGALLPLLLMDAQYMLFCEKVRDLEFGEVENRADLLYQRDKWHEAYNDFNRSIFRAWNKVQRDYVCDMMDSFEKALHNDLLILQVTAMNQMTHLELGFQDTISTCVVCNVLAQYAQMMWGIVFRDRNYKKKINKKIKEVEDYSKGFEDEVYKLTLSHVDVNFNLDKTFNQAMDNIASKMMNWLKNYR